MDLWDALERADPEDVQAALARGANPNAISSEGYTALDLAAEMADAAGDPELVGLLLEAGARADGPDRHGLTALFYALRQDQPAVAEALLARGASVDRRHPTHGSTPLLVAIEHGSARVARLLLARGADPNVSATPAYTASLREGWSGQRDLVGSLYAGSEDDFSRAELAVMDGLLRRVPPERAVTPAVLAAAGGHVELLAALREAGARPSDEDEALIGELLALRGGPAQKRA